jgi:hypothetical protein
MMFIIKDPDNHPTSFPSMESFGTMIPLRIGIRMILLLLLLLLLLLHQHP